MLALSLVWLLPYLQVVLGWSAVQSGRAYSLIMAASIAVNLLIAWITQSLIAKGGNPLAIRLRMAIIVLGTAGLTLVLIQLPFWPPMWRMAFVAVSMMLVPAINSIVPVLLAHIVAGPGSTVVIAVDNSVASLAAIIAPVVMGHLVQGSHGGTGYETAFASSGLVMLLAAALGWMLVLPQWRLRDKGR